MGKNYIDISAYLDNSKPGLIIAPGEEYEIDDRKNTILKIQALMNKSKEGDSEFDAMTKALEALLGKESLKAIEENHPGMTTRLSSLKVIFTATMAAINGIDYEAADARFPGK